MKPISDTAPGREYAPTSHASPTFWSEVWTQRLADYLAGPARTGRYLHHRLRGDARGILEIAAGSSRDSLFLHDKGYSDVLATDFCESSVADLRRLFPRAADVFHVADAYALPFQDKSFDVVFHNGFLVLMRDDEDIVRLIRAQLRIARRWLVMMVHNGQNCRLVQQYKRAAATDRLYDIRVFSPEEIVSLCIRAGVPRHSISIEKFGGPADILTSKRIKALPNPAHSFLHAVPPLLYQYQPWRSVERIACWIRA